jgi:hypothetical protein
VGTKGISKFPPNRDTGEDIHGEGPLNANAPRFECLLRKEFLYNDEAHHGETVPCVVFAVASLPGRAVGFRVMTNRGVQLARLPIEALCWKPCRRRPTHILELWNAFSYDCEVIEYDFLENMRCLAHLRDGSSVGGEYVWTVDWYGSADAEDTGDLGHKDGHLIRLDDGNFALLPNNRIYWAEPSFIEPLTERPDYRTLDKTFTCEQTGKWLAGTDDKMFFEIKEMEEP